MTRQTDSGREGGGGRLLAKVIQEVNTTRYQVREVQVQI